MRKFVPVRFDNLVWFSDQELLDQLHAAVPLFQGQLPVAGELVDEVSNALQGLLIAHNVQGEANYLSVGPKMARSSVCFLGGSADPYRQDRDSPEQVSDELPLLESAARRMLGADFSVRPFVFRRTKVFFRFIFSQDIEGDIRRCGGQGC